MILILFNRQVKICFFFSVFHKIIISGENIKIKIKEFNVDKLKNILFLQVIIE